MSSITHGSRSKNIGRFELAADDCGSVSINVACNSEYPAAKARELTEIGLSVSCDQILSKNDDKANKGKITVTHTAGTSFNRDVTPPTMELNTKSDSESTIGQKLGASTATKMEQSASNPMTPDKSKIIRMTSEQSENLRFPSGTPVWWFVRTDGSSGTYKHGVVCSVSYDITSRDLLYEVTPNGQGAESMFFSEMDLGYAPSCHVLISPCSDDHLSARELFDQGGDLLEGNVLLSKREMDSWVYTASVQDEAGNVKLLENIPSLSVFYRRNYD